MAVDSKTKGEARHEREVELLHGLVDIPSLSGEEHGASSWLVERMGDLGLERCQVDEAGNAVGELGAADATRTVVLLGHIDTVPGNIPVRFEGSGEERVLHGRGSVDAKGPLATFVAAAARLGGQWARAHDLRLVVAGAVEEESATSKGARFLRQRFSDQKERRPDACFIGEPSRWNRLTLGYKGRLLINVQAHREWRHSAGPDPGLPVVVVDLWRAMEEMEAAFNAGRGRVFDRLQASLRKIESATDGLEESVEATFGLRLPLDFDAPLFCSQLVARAAALIETEPSVGDVQAMGGAIELEPGADRTLLLESDSIRLRMTFRGYEQAFRSERSSPVSRSLIRGIRQVTSDVRPRFVLKTGTSDMNVVAPSWKCPIVAYGPGDSALDHTPHEHLPIAEYLRAIQALEGALRALPTLLGSDSSDHLHPVLP